MPQFAVREDPRNGVVIREIRDLIPDYREAIRQGWFSFMDALKKRANAEILRKPKSGRVYILRDKAGRRRRHVASAPGETHANLSGATRRSIGWRVNGWETATFGYGVSSSGATVAPAWAPYLERGTLRMAPRPSLANAIRDVSPESFFEPVFRRQID